jgi:hypothetical protein
LPCDGLVDWAPMRIALPFFSNWKVYDWRTDQCIHR